MAAGTGKQLETKESETRLVEEVTPFIRPIETGKKWKKKPNKTSKLKQNLTDMGMPRVP